MIHRHDIANPQSHGSVGECRRCSGGGHMSTRSLIFWFEIACSIVITVIKIVDIIWLD